VEVPVTPAGTRRLGSALIAIAIIAIVVQLCAMLHYIPKFAPTSAVTYPAFLVAVVGGRLYRRGSAAAV
jgi:hypothetical protein